MAKDKGTPKGEIEKLTGYIASTLGLSNLSDSDLDAIREQAEKEGIDPDKPDYAEVYRQVVDYATDKGLLKGKKAEAAYKEILLAKLDQISAAAQKSGDLKLEKETLQITASLLNEVTAAEDPRKLLKKNMDVLTGLIWGEFHKIANDYDTDLSLGKLLMIASAAIFQDKIEQYVRLCKEPEAKNILKDQGII